MTPDQPITAMTVTSAPPPQTRPPLREILDVLKAADPSLVRQIAGQIVEREIAAALFDQDSRLATSFALSGLFDNLRGVPQDAAICRAMTFVQLGRSWGMTPGDSMQYIEFNQGKPAVRNEYLAARMRDGGLSWDFDWHRDDKGDCIGCTLLLKQRQSDGTYNDLMERVNGKETRASVTFTKADAKKVPAKERGNDITLDQKSTYLAFADDMYYWKCIARVKRRYCTNVLSAMMPTVDDEREGDDDGQPSLPPVAPQVITTTPARRPKPAPDLVPLLEESLRMVEERKV